MFRRRPPIIIRKKACPFCLEKKEPSYLEVEVLRRFISDRGKIISRLRSGACQKHQKRLAVSVKRARFLNLLPFIAR
jgi:small subunit ribosomal protein S18